MKVSSFLCFTLLAAADVTVTAFTACINNNKASLKRTEPGVAYRTSTLSSVREGQDYAPPTKVASEGASSFNPLPVGMASLCLISSTAANAAGPDWGVFEGKTGSLLHPTMMFGMLMLSASTALLGFEWRRQRTIGDEISTLKKSLPKLDGASSVAEAVKACQSMEQTDSALLAKLKSAIPIESEIKELQNERKSLAAKGPRDKHYGQGSMLAFLGTVFAIEGPLNTYARAGKLFPGPHLYAGAGLVALWALALATVPQMQKGNDTARSVHIGANVAGIGLFLWQLQSGIPILLKVWEKTSWP